MSKIKGLREYKKYLIGTITTENKKEINRLTRQIDKEIKRLLINENTTDTTLSTDIQNEVDTTTSESNEVDTNTIE